MSEGLSNSTTVKLVFQILISLVLLGGLIFLPAGTLQWPAAWWFLGLFGVEMIIGFALLLRANPEIITARQKMTAEGTQSWDVPIMIGQIIGLLAIAPLAGLDFRWGGGQFPFWLIIIGNLMFGFGFALMLWAQAVNRHFEPSVRIQTDRDHKVISDGPYAYVRHPGYVAATFLAVGMALALGSLWALVPAVIVKLLLLYRTVREDRLLQEELNGYAEFARNTRYRWVPGVW